MKIKKQKKWIISLLLSCLMLIFTGCGAKKVVDSIALKNQDVESSQEEQDTETAREAEIEEDKEHPILGENIEEYEGFTYLYDEVLMTDSEQNKETGKMEKKRLVVYLPQSEYVSSNKDSIWSSALGVGFDVALEPYVRGEAKDYLPTENLESILENTYDPFYTTEYKDLVVGEVESLGENGARATVEYCLYDDYDDDYNAVFVTYYFAELEDGLTVLASAQINSKEATGKTPLLLEELERFYQFDIGWDADRAAQKAEKSLTIDEQNMFSTGYLLFELPKGWEAEYAYGNYDMYTYAPDGNAAYSGCVIAISGQYATAGSAQIKSMVNNSEEIDRFLSEMFGDDIKDLEVEDYGKTCLGNAFKMSFQIADDTLSGKFEVYLIAAKDSIYTVYAIQTDHADEDPFVVVEDILQNGRVNDKY